MPVNTFNFTTGPATLPDVGALAYNGCTFGPLFTTTVSGKCVKDAANRTVKYMEYVLTADGYVTLAAGNTDINPSIATLRNLLTKQAGALTYTGRGFNLTINTAGAQVGGAASGQYDVAWGPVPELIEFQPLGGGLSAKVQWKVTVRITEEVGKTSGLLQFNCETTVTYGEDYFSALSVRGTMEIPLTRAVQTSRVVTSTVDEFRGELDKRIFAGIDLARFRVVRRDYSISRDKRTMEFDVAVEERSYMDLPPGCPIARGTYSVRPAKAGMGLALWLCTLRATYIVRADAPRRTAWIAFLALLRLRMNQAVNAYLPPEFGEQNPKLAALGLGVPGFISTVGPAAGGAVAGAGDTLGAALLAGIPGVINYARKRGKPAAGLQNLPAGGNVQVTQKSGRAAWIIDFSFDEGIYLDSKSVSFSATWRLAATFGSILLASGLWRKVPERIPFAGSLWAISMQDVSGSRSWLPNVLDPQADVIVDFGG